MSAKPATLVLALEPKLVVSIISYLVSRVTLEIDELKSVPAIEIDGLVRTNFAICYETAFVIAPVIGHVTDAVASVPIPPLSGCHSETFAVKLYVGLVDDTDDDAG